MLGLLPAVPDLISLIRRSRGLIVLCLTVAALAASPSVIDVLLGIYHHDLFLEQLDDKSAGGVSPPLIATSRTARSAIPVTRRERKYTIGAVIVICTLSLVSMLDLAGFYIEQHNTGLIQIQGDRHKAIALAAKPSGGGLIFRYLHRSALARSNHRAANRHDERRDGMALGLRRLDQCACVTRSGSH